MNIAELPPSGAVGNGTTRRWRHIPGDHRRRETQESYDIFWDDVHQFGKVYPRPKNADEALAFYETTDNGEYYTHVGAGQDRGPRARSRLPWHLVFHLAWRFDRSAQELEQEIDRLCEKRPAAILDVGCGRGELLEHCRRRGHSVMGLEPDRVPREAANAQGLQVFDGSGEQLPDAVLNRRFDVITCRHALHHTIDPDLSIRNLADRLVEGGRLVCEVPNQYCLAAQWSGIAWGALDIPRQLNVFTAQSLSHMMEQASLRVEEVHWMRYCGQFSEQAINHQKRKYDFFRNKGAGRDVLPVKPSLLSHYALLARTCVAPPESKYPSVRVIARKPGSTEGRVS
jgi:2-polyprenyl-3-methyl-5-hydroxy-6-metoxy-1,4-benzoquinol methylase